MQWGVRLYFCVGAASVLSRPPMALFCGSSPGRLGDVLRTNLKNGMFLTVPVYQISANAARTPHAATFSRLRSSSDFSRLRLLRAAEFWYSGAVRNITVFSYGV